MHSIVRSSLQFQFLVITIAIVTLFFGAFRLSEMPVATLPEFDPPIVEIQTEALGLSAEEVEAMITVPLEADLLNGVAWLEAIHSESMSGLSSIQLMFEPGTDLIRARQMVAERLTQAHALPNVSKPPVMLQPLSSTRRVMIIGISSEELSLIEMSVLARWTIVPRLQGVPGVANVSIWGQRKRQLQVQVDPEELRIEGVTLQQVVTTTGEALWVSPLSYLESSTPGTGGFIDTPNQRLGVRHILPIVTPDDLAQVALVDSQQLVLGDVANVVEDHQLLIGDTILEDSEGLLLIVEKFPGENTLEVTQGVEDALDNLQPGLTGLEVDTNVFRPANYVEDSVDNLTRTIIISTILVVLALFAFFNNWRRLVVSIVAIPLSLAVAGLILTLVGATMNAMVFAGLLMGLGAVVANAIVDVENIVRLLRQNRETGGKKAIAEIILASSTEIRSSLAYASLIIIAAVIPVFFLEGRPGAFYGPLALAYVLAVLSSMLVALIVTPALGLLFLRSPSLEDRQAAVLKWLANIYQRIVAPFMSPTMTYGVLLVVVLVGLVGLPFLEIDIMPDFKERELVIIWEGVPGTSLPAMNRSLARMTSELQTIPGVTNVSTHVGRAILSEDVVGVHSAKLWVSLNEDADYEATLESVQEVIGDYPGFSHDVGTYLQNTASEVQISEYQDVVVRIYGYELNVLNDLALDVQQRLRQIDGIDDPQVRFQSIEPQVEIRVDLAAAERYGLKPGDVRRSAAILLSGIEVGSLFEEQKVFDVIVWSQPETRDSVTDVQNLLIDTPGGGHVRLGDVAVVEIKPITNVIERDAVSRIIDVQANVSGRSISAVQKDVESALEEIAFPPEYHVEILGGGEARQATRQRLIGIAIASAIGIFLLLQAAFSSWRLAAIVFFSLPSALAGGVIAALIAGGTISIGSFAGFLTVFGIATFNSVLLFRHFRQLSEQEDGFSGLDLVLNGTQQRLIPILMITVVTALAFLPLLLLGDIPGHEVGHPMSITVLGGLATALLLNLFILPVLYIQLELRDWTISDAN